jgi:hypothetical protein
MFNPKEYVGKQVAEIGDFFRADGSPLIKIKSLAYARVGFLGLSVFLGLEAFLQRDVHGQVEACRTVAGHIAQSNFCHSVISSREGISDQANHANTSNGDFIVLGAISGAMSIVTALGSIAPEASVNEVLEELGNNLTAETEVAPNQPTQDLTLPAIA